VAIQRLADLIGLAKLYEDVHLCVHKEYGPWIAFRAVVVMNENADDFMVSSTNNTSGDVITKEELANAVLAFKKAEYDISNTEAWILLRDSIPRFQKYKYTEEQLYYHYTKDKSILKSAVSQKQES